MAQLKRHGLEDELAAEAARNVPVKSEDVARLASRRAEEEAKRARRIMRRAEEGEPRGEIHGER